MISLVGDVFLPLDLDALQIKRLKIFCASILSHLHDCHQIPKAGTYFMGRYYPADRGNSSGMSSKAPGKQTCIITADSLEAVTYDNSVEMGNRDYLKIFMSMHWKAQSKLQNSLNKHGRKSSSILNDCLGIFLRVLIPGTLGWKKHICWFTSSQWIWRTCRVICSLLSTT